MAQCLIMFVTSYYNCGEVAELHALYVHSYKLSDSSVVVQCYQPHFHRNHINQTCVQKWNKQRGRGDFPRLHAHDSLINYQLLSDQLTDAGHGQVTAGYKTLLLTQWLTSIILSLFFIFYCCKYCRWIHWWNSLLCRSLVNIGRSYSLNIVKSN